MRVSAHSRPTARRCKQTLISANSTGYWHLPKVAESQFLHCLALVSIFGNELLLLLVKECIGNGAPSCLISDNNIACDGTSWGISMSVLSQRCVTMMILLVLNIHRACSTNTCLAAAVELLLYKLQPLFTHSTRPQPES
jgi:hypothetical protein